ncbi:hypothetical protein [Gulbenkiania indica]|uniref:hypothetical protein n=1 Tax=Gulbenkiania indica TaxID=375574 RepID=UPI001146AC54|nr:hypothetical protein [Gulbenkiania indica]
MNPQVFTGGEYRAEAQHWRALQPVHAAARFPTHEARGRGGVTSARAGCWQGVVASIRPALGSRKATLGWPVVVWLG